MACAVDGCPKPASTRGWCRAHYERWRRNGDPGPPGDARRRIETACEIDGCDGPAKKRGWCEKHYLRWRRHRDPLHNERPTLGSGRVVNGRNGYVRVRAPEHPLADSIGYVYEHRMMAYDAGLLGAGQEVHHINGDKADNRLENFEITTRAEHQRKHLSERGVVSNQYGTWPVRR